MSKKDKKKKLKKQNAELQEKTNKIRTKHDIADAVIAITGGIVGGYAAVYAIEHNIANQERESLVDAIVAGVGAYTIVSAIGNEIKSRLLPKKPLKIAEIR